MGGKGKNEKKEKKHPSSSPMLSSSSGTSPPHSWSPCHFFPPVLSPLSLFLPQVHSVPLVEVMDGTGDGDQFTVVPLCLSFLLSVCPCSGMSPPLAGVPLGCACSTIMFLLLLWPCVPSVVLSSVPSSSSLPVSLSPWMSHSVLFLVEYVSPRCPRWEPWGLEELTNINLDCN